MFTLWLPSVNEYIKPYTRNYCDVTECDVLSFCYKRGKSGEVKVEYIYSSFENWGRQVEESQTVIYWDNNNSASRRDYYIEYYNYENYHN